MNKTVELVSEWVKYQAKFPDGAVVDFCRYYLANQTGKKTKGPLVGGVIPNATDGVLLKIIGRISRLNLFYASQALSGTEVNMLEEFGMLATIQQNKNPKKTEVITANLFELSSGTDMLARLIRRGLIKEYADDQDKRSKRVELTSKGQKTVEVCLKRVIKNAQFLLQDLTDDDKKLCIEILKNVETKFSMLWPEHKGKSFDDIVSGLQRKKK